MDWLKSIVDLWLSHIQVCRDVKERQFGKSAAKIWGFYGKSYKDLVASDGLGERIDADYGFHEKTRINKTQEFVSLMLPRIHEKVPHRVCRSRAQDVPPDLLMHMQRILGFPIANAGQKSEDRVRAWQMERWLNYIPGEYDLFRESRTAIIEALVKGRGVTWSEMIEGPHGRIPATFYDTVDSLLIDSNCLQYRDAGYIVRERIRTVWQVEQDFGIPADTLRGKYQSYQQQAKSRADAYRSGGNHDTEEKDLCRYYEVWSRVGFGQWFNDAGDTVKNTMAAVENVGNNVFLAILPGLNYPLNLPEDRIDQMTAEEIKQRIEWPMAFHAEPVDPWPCTFLDFLPNTENCWATPILEAALPLQVFLDAIYTFCMRRVKVTSRDLMVISKSLSEEIKHIAINGIDLEALEYDGDANEISKLLHIVQFPDMNKDVWSIIQAIERKWEQSTGMEPGMYGAEPERQMRSAAEAQSRHVALNSRPDDYAGCVMAWQSRIAAKEGQASRLYVRPETVAPSFGEQAPDLSNPQTAATSPMSWLWAALVNTDDPAIAAAEVEYTCEAGAGSRMNKQKLVSDAGVLTQQLLPTFMQFAAQGNVKPYNNLMGLLADAYEMPLNKLSLEEAPSEMAQPEQEPFSDPTSNPTQPQ
jgi:hypothetical protein